MPQPWTIFLTALATLVVTVVSGLLLDFVRNARPTIRYYVRGAVPIDLGDGKHVGAYVLFIENKSKRVVKELTCHVEAGEAKLRNGGIASSPGLQMDNSRERQVSLGHHTVFKRWGKPNDVGCGRGFVHSSYASGGADHRMTPEF
jgi:hypothetical protein